MRSGAVVAPSRDRHALADTYTEETTSEGGSSALGQGLVMTSRGSRLQVTQGRPTGLGPRVLLPAGRVGRLSEPSDHKQPRPTHHQGISFESRRDGPLRSKGSSP